MKNATLILVLVTAVLAVVGTASAELTLYIDGAGQAYINNDAGSAVTFDAYEIHSGGSLLDPSEYYPGQTSGWRSFGDWITEDMMGAFAALGSVTWGELAAQTYVVADGNLSGVTTLADGGSLFVGLPAPSAAVADSHTAGSGDYGDLQFYYMNAAVSTEKIDGNIEVVPDPATLSLLGPADWPADDPADPPAEENTGNSHDPPPDYLHLLTGSYNMGPPPPLPEPGTMVLVSLGFLGMLVRRGPRADHDGG